MRLHRNNAVKFKRKLKPDDYCRDQTCKVTLRSGRELVLPTVLLIALRNGQVKVLEK